VTFPSYVAPGSTNEMGVAPAARGLLSSQFSDLLGLMQAGGRSDLVAAAERAREHQQREQGVRTYTNQDIERIQHQSGVSQPKGITIPAPH